MKSNEELLNELSETFGETDEELLEANLEEYFAPEELEFDLNNPEELDKLLGIKDKNEPKDDEDDLSKLLESLESDEVENKDVTELLDSMGSEDEGLSEISELLKQSESSEPTSNDDMYAFLESLSAEDSESSGDSGEFDFFALPDAENEEEQQEEVPKKKEKKKLGWPFRRKNKKESDNEEADTFGETITEKTSEEETKTTLGADTAGGEEKEQTEGFADFDLLSAFGSASGPENAEANPMVEEHPVKEKKQGFFGKLLHILTYEVEEETDLPLEAEVKEKKKKDKKDKKGKKKENAELSADDNGAILDSLDEEEEPEKGKKKEKVKKPKREKIKKVNPEDAFDGTKLPRKMVIRIFVLCFSFMALLILAANFLPRLITLNSARKAFYKKDYLTAYQEMIGQELNESDAIILKKATMVLKLQRKYNAYNNFKAMGMEAEALNALLQGQLVYYDIYEEAVSYNMQNEVEQIYASILEVLSDTYGLSEQDAIDINSLETDLAYTKAVRAVVADEYVSENVDVSEEVKEEVVEEQEHYEDLLPEEVE